MRGNLLGRTQSPQKRPDVTTSVLVAAVEQATMMAGERWNVSAAAVGGVAK
jgi:hypothetical protein